MLSIAASSAATGQRGVCPPAARGSGRTGGDRQHPVPAVSEPRLAKYLHQSSVGERERVIRHGQDRLPVRDPAWILAYASYSRGYKAGGFNLDRVQCTIGSGLRAGHGRRPLLRSATPVSRASSSTPMKSARRRPCSIANCCSTSLCSTRSTPASSSILSPVWCSWSSRSRRSPAVASTPTSSGCR